MIHQRIAAIIPARLDSKRLPGKMLLDSTGKPLIQHTYEAVKRCNNIDYVAVATGDKDIKDVVIGFGGNVISTDVECDSGTNRVAHAVRALSSGFTSIINVQGDEPEIDDRVINKLIMSSRNNHASVYTIATEITDKNEFMQPNVVKVVTQVSCGLAVYFSRSPIPYHRAGHDKVFGLRHVGVYMFDRVFLDNIINSKPTPLECAEVLEQVRWLENGQRIWVDVMPNVGYSIDTIDDYGRFVMRYSELHR